MAVDATKPPGPAELAKQSAVVIRVPDHLQAKVYWRERCGPLQDPEQEGMIKIGHGIHFAMSGTLCVYELIRLDIWSPVRQGSVSTENDSGR